MSALSADRSLRERERERIREALVAAIDGDGYSGTSVDDVLSRAGLSRDAFESHFPNLDACFAEVWEGFTQSFVDRALAAYGAAGNWRDGMRAQAWEFCRFLQEDHLRARICMVEVAFGGALVQASRDVFMDAYVELVHLGRLEREQAAALPRERAEGIVGAIWERVATNVGAGDFAALTDEVPRLMYLMVLPYFGLEAAQEELRRGEVPPLSEKR